MYELQMIFTIVMPVIMVQITYWYASVVHGKTMFMSALFSEDQHRDIGFWVLLLSATYPIIVSGINYYIGFPSPFNEDNWQGALFLTTAGEMLLMWGSIGIVAISDIRDVIKVRDQHFAQRAYHNIDFSIYDEGQYLIRVESNSDDTSQTMTLYRIAIRSDLTGDYKILVYQHQFVEPIFTTDCVKARLKQYFDSIVYYTADKTSMSKVELATKKIPDVIVID